MSFNTTPYNLLLNGGVGVCMYVFIYKYHHNL